MMSFSRRDITPRCPRCGYDLRGLVATWADRCPLEGVCSECGLTLRWAEVLLPEKFEPPWCVEFAPRGWAVLLACVRTLLWSLRPWTFWRRLKMSQPIRWRRLAAYLLLLAATVYTTFALSQGVLAWHRWWRIEKSPSLVYTDVDGYTVFVHAAALPFSDSPPGSYSEVWRTRGGRLRGFSHIYRSPLDHARRRIAHEHAALFLGVVFITCPLVFAALPISRRRAKVRWSHVLRVTAYSTSYVALAAIIIIVSNTAGLVGGRSFVFSDSIALLESLTLVALCPGMLIWWAVAIRRYLRMEHAFGVAVAVGTTAFLAACVVLFIVHPSFIVIPVSRVLFPRWLFPT